MYSTEGPSSFSKAHEDWRYVSLMTIGIPEDKLDEPQCLLRDPNTVSIHKLMSAIDGTYVGAEVKARGISKISYMHITPSGRTFISSV